MKIVFVRSWVIGVEVSFSRRSFRAGTYILHSPQRKIWA